MCVSDDIIADIPDTFGVKFVSESQVTERHLASCCNGSIIYMFHHLECTF